MMYGSLRVTGQNVVHTREAGLDLRGRDGADAEPEPARLARQPEGLERNDGEAGVVEEQPADLLVGLDRATADEIEPDGEVDRPLRRNRSYWQTVCAHGIDAAEEE